MELTYTDIIYLCFAVSNMLDRDMAQADKDAYEKLLLKLRLSHKAEKMRKTLRVNEMPSLEEWQRMHGYSSEKAHSIEEAKSMHGWFMRGNNERN